MSRHEGVSCDSCLKGNFRGRRYKCLICYDYDLCATCYESGATTTRHTTDHPMQCILTRTDFDLYYGGEALTAEQPQAFTCPFCGKMGYTETTLQEHVTSEHADTNTEVVCPICAALPGGDPNHVTDDFAAHLTLEHRSPRDFDEPAGIRHTRRIPHPSRGVGATRTRRTNMHFSSAGSTLTGLSPSGRETMDPIAELLSQLSSVRNRAAAAQSVSSQLQQLEMQLHSTRQQLERLPRRSTDSTVNTGRNAVAGSGPGMSTDLSSSTSSNNNNTPSSQFLLPRCTDSSCSENGGQNVEAERTDRGLFVQELLLSTLTEHLQLGDFSEWISSLSEQTETGPHGSQPPSGDGASPPQSSSNEMVETKRSQRPPPPADVSSQGVKRKASSTTTTQGQVGVGSGVVQPMGQQAQVLVPGPAIRAPLSPGQSVHPNPGTGAGVAVGASPQSHTRPSPTGLRDPRMNPPATKRNLLKHVEATKKSEPPPH